MEKFLKYVFWFLLKSKPEPFTPKKDPPTTNPPEPAFERWNALMEITVFKKHEGKEVTYKSENEFGLKLDAGLLVYDSNCYAPNATRLCPNHICLEKKNGPNWVGDFIGLFEGDVISLVYKTQERQTVTTVIFDYIGAKHKIMSFNEYGWGYFSDVKIWPKELTHEEKEELIKYGIGF